MTAKNVNHQSALFPKYSSRSKAVDELLKCRDHSLQRLSLASQLTFIAVCDGMLFLSDNYCSSRAVRWPKGARHQYSDRGLAVSGSGLVSGCLVFVAGSAEKTNFSEQLVYKN